MNRKVLTVIILAGCPYAIYSVEPFDDISRRIEIAREAGDLEDKLSAPLVRTIAIINDEELPAAFNPLHVAYISGGPGSTDE